MKKEMQLATGSESNTTTAVVTFSYLFIEDLTSVMIKLQGSTFN